MVLKTHCDVTNHHFDRTSAHHNSIVRNTDMVTCTPGSARGRLGLVHNSAWRRELQHLTPPQPATFVDCE
jgi:hypothetical protein